MYPIWYCTTYQALSGYCVIHSNTLRKYLSIPKRGVKSVVLYVSMRYQAVGPVSSNTSRYKRKYSQVRLSPSHTRIRRWALSRGPTVWGKYGFRAGVGDISFIYFLHISLAAGRYFGKFLRSLNSCGSQSQVLSTSFWRGLHFPVVRGKISILPVMAVVLARAARDFQGFGLSGT